MKPFKKLGVIAVFTLSLLAVQTSIKLYADEGIDNPFFKPFTGPFATIPFEKIKAEHYIPAIKEGIRLEQEEVQKIADNPNPPTFANTILAMDRTGSFLDIVNSAFGGVYGAHTSPELQMVAQESSPLLSAHSSFINLNDKLFARVKAVYEQRDKLNLNTEQRYRLESVYRNFVRSGALLDQAQKDRLKKIFSDLSLTSLKFGQNLLAETNASFIVIDKTEDLAGLDDGVISMAADKAKELGVKPMARIVGGAVCAVEPEIMGYGPVPCTQKLLAQTGLKLEDIGLIEVNEAFAAQYLVCEKLLGLNRDITNVNGGAIALGHPGGPTGVRLVVTMLYEMRRRGVALGLATLCGGNGPARAVIIEAL